MRDEVFAVLQLIDRLHRPALGELASRLEEAGLWEEVLDDEHLQVLFKLYDLAPLDPVEQAEAALDPVRPYIESHGGAVEVLEASGGVVRLRLRGSCESCSASSATLSHGVEVALAENFPGFERMEIEEPPPTGDGETAARDDGEKPGGEKPGGEKRGSEKRGSEKLVQLRAPSFDDLVSLSELEEEAASILEHGEKEVLIVRLGDEVYAYDPTCPDCGTSLRGAKVSPPALVCPLSNCAFDARSGRRIDGVAGTPLQTYPVSVRDGRVLLASGVQPVALFGAP